MTKLFVFVFLCMFTYGAFVYMWGPALIALFCACFMYWAGNNMDKQYWEFLDDPENAREIFSSADMLNHRECDCSACTGPCSKTQGQILKSDYEI